MYDITRCATQFKICVHMYSWSDMYAYVTICAHMYDTYAYDVNTLLSIPSNMYDMYAYNVNTFLSLPQSTPVSLNPPLRP